MKKIILFVILITVVAIVGCQQQADSSKDTTSVEVADQREDIISDRSEPSLGKGSEIKFELEKISFDCPLSSDAEEDISECIKIVLKDIIVDGDEWYANFLVTNNHDYSHAFTPYGAAIIIDGIQYDESELIEGSTTPVHQGATKKFLMKYSNLPNDVSGEVEIILGSMNWGILENPIKMEISLTR